MFEILVSKEIIAKHNELFGKKNIGFGKKSIIEKPLILIDVDGFFKPFEKLVDSVISAGFMPKTNKKFFKIVKNPKEAINYIKKQVKK